MDSGVERMCVACRKKAAQRVLLRFVRHSSGQLYFDVRAKLQDRGAWTCAKFECVSKALDRKGFARAFGEQVHAELAQLKEEIAGAIKNGVLQNLGLAKRAQALEGGRDRVERDLQAGAAIAVVLAHDVSERTAHDFVNCGVPVFVGPSKDEIGAAIGRAETGVVALRKARMNEQLIWDLQRLQGLGIYPASFGVVNG